MDECRPLPPAVRGVHERLQARNNLFEHDPPHPPAVPIERSRPQLKQLPHPGPGRYCSPRHRMRFNSKTRVQTRWMTGVQYLRGRTDSAAPSGEASTARRAASTPSRSAQQMLPATSSTRIPNPRVSNDLASKRNMYQSLMEDADAVVRALCDDVASNIWQAL